MEHMDSLKRWPGVRVQVFPLSLEEIFIELSGERENTTATSMFVRLQEENEQSSNVMAL